MATRIKIWQKMMDFIFGWIFTNREKRRLHRSMENSFIDGNSRDSFRYYDKGRWVTIEAELLIGEFDRVIYRRCPLNWNDNGQSLTPDEREKALKELCDYFNKNGIKWKFSDATNDNR